MPARIHPGAVVHVWDHFVIGLRDPAGVPATPGARRPRRDPAASRAAGGKAAPAEEREESLLSLYAIALSPSLGSGYVALLYGPGRPDVILAEPIELGGRMQQRWRDMDPATRGVDAPVVRGRFERRAVTEGGFGWTIESELGTLEARWLEPKPAIWVEGPAPAFWDREDIWCCFVDAPAASLTLGDWSAPGSVFDDQRWVPKLGRTLTSAHVAYAETRVQPSSRP